MAAVPFFAPGLIIWSAIALVISPPVGRFLRTSRLHAALLILALGLIVMATLTPTGAALTGTGSQWDACDLTRIGVAPLSVLLHLNDKSLNVALFVPLGLALGSLPLSRRSALVAGVALLLPLAVELLQLAFPALGRRCESADVIDNTMGLIIGLAIGLAGGWLLARPRRA